MTRAAAPIGRQFLLIAESGDDDPLGADGSGSGACSAEWNSEYHRCGHGVHGGRNPSAGKSHHHLGPEALRARESANELNWRLSRPLRSRIRDSFLLGP